MTDRHVRAPSRPRIPLQRSTTPPVEPRRHAPPRTPRRGTRLALLLPLTVGGAAVLVAVAVGIGVLGNQTVRTTHAFAITSSAAGMTREPAQETAYAEQVAGVKDSFRAQFSGRLAQFVTAVYANPDAAPGRPAGPVVFVGAAIDSRGDPADFVESFRTQAEAAGATVTTPDVGQGALGICSQSAEAPAVTSCAWSTGDSVGQVVPTVDGWDAATLGAATRAFRAALEVRTVS